MSQNARFPYMPSIHPFSESMLRSPTNYSRAITMFSSVALLSFLPGVHWISWHAHHRLLNPYHPLILRHKRYLPPTLSYSILHSCKYRYPSSTPPPLHLSHVESIRSSGPYEVLPPRTVRTRSPRKITSTRLPTPPTRRSCSLRHGWDLSLIHI